MAAYDTLRAAIDSYIKANGNKEITGTVLNDILNAMVSALGADTRFAGVAVPTTNPGNPEGNVVYFASQAGTYSNFGGIVLPLGIHILVWNGTAWTSQTWFSVDNTPTQNSQNLATSGGILQAIVDAVGVERLRAIGAEVTSCSFDSNTKKISFFNSADDTLFQLDATAFVIDGMVSDVKIEDGNLVIQFNTDAGKQDIEIPLTDIFNPANYYTKTAIDALLASYYTKTETDALLTAINNKLADGCLYRGMAEPTTNPPTPTTKVFYIATKAGTYTNFGNIAVTEGITILKHDGSNWSKEQICYSDGVFDISAYNGTSYADLSAALGTNGANIPQNLRKGGMSVKFVQSSDNKYVQYLYHGTSVAVADFTNTDNWEKMNLEEEVNQLDQKIAGIIGDNIQTTWIDHKIIYTGGQMLDSSDANMYASDYIPVLAGQHIRIICSANGAISNVCCLYNENKIKIGDYFQVNDNQLPDGISIEVPQGAYYLRLSNDVSKVAQPYIFVEKVSDNAETLKSLTNKVLDLEEIGRNIYEELPVSWIDGQFINLHGNLSSNASKQASDWIPVKAGEKYMLFVNASGANNDVLALYNEGKTFLSYIQISALYYFNGYLLTIAQDGYFRTSNTPAEVSNPKIYKIINSSNSKLVGDIGYKIKNIIEPTYRLNPTGELSIKWQSGWGVRYNGTVSHSTLPEGSTGVKCSDYIFLQKGQTIKLNYWAVSPYAHVIYDLDKETILSYFYSDVKEPVFYYATQDCYIRITSILNDLGIKESAYILLNTTTLDATRVMNFIQKDSFIPLMNQNNKLYNFTPLLRKSDKKYTGQVSPQKRYLYCGFDDFRPSDFEWVIPLFAKYGFKATFNRIHKDIDANNEEDAARVNMVYFSGNELGDHTLYHSMYPFFSPLWNGQNPSSAEGSQIPFPSNSQMRDEVGSTGKNIFGVSLTSNPVDTLPLSDSLGITTPWGQLSDAECQQIRDFYSVMKSPTVVSTAGNKTMIQCLDLMSNKYLGTTGSSNGSWDSTTQKYTGGIFTGCATSQNHEIWERILQCVASYYKVEFNFGDDIVTWSLPGSANGSLYFSDANGYKYYDEQKTKLANCNAKFESSLYKNLDGTPKLRSWTDVLREYGYNNTHDQYSPGRYDGTGSTVMSHQFIINSGLSRKDGIPYSTELDVMWYQDGSPYNDFTEAFFQSHNTYDYPTEMYNYHKAGNKGFYKTIENLRHLSANGILCGSQWDSQYKAKPEQIYWEGILQYCKATGMEILTKAEAFDVAFNHYVEYGNLIYNPLLRNTAKEFMPNGDVPSNPDGYVGNCSVNHDSNNVPILVTTGNVIYNHFGIPVGDIKYSALVKGSGTITIKVIKNWNKFDLSDLSTIATLQIDSSSEFTTAEQNINIYDAANTAWEQIFEGLGDKICGIQIIYSSGLEVKNIKLYKN